MKLLNMCKRFRVTFGLVVTALAVALLCNVYLVFLLWSGGVGKTNDDEHVSTSPQPVVVIKPEVSIKLMNSGLNIDYLKSMLNVTKRLSRSRSRSLITSLNKLKRELISQKPSLEPADLIKISSKWVSPRSLIPSFAPELGNMIEYLQASPIVRASVPHVGTQLKVMVTLEGGQKALLKPQWYNRSTLIDGVVYSGADRHNGEIVAFYLSLLLDMRRTPVAVGRMINLSTEILAKADKDLAATFYKNNQSHTCFYGVCRYCKPELSVCGDDSDLLESTFILWLPTQVKLKSHRSPWQRTYKKNLQAQWETADNFCHNLQKQKVLSQRRLLDLVDASVFDFLISNGDRHHYEIVDGYSDSEAAVLLLDNGKSFGRPDVDYMDILAPLYQCCMIRKSTYMRLEMLESGPLGTLIEELTFKDGLFPLLTDEHVQAINRRLAAVMQTIELCAKVKSWDSVVLRVSY